jgi:photosystem II stability/assembly factor-like uncharacterized protein
MLVLSSPLAAMRALSRAICVLVVVAGMAACSGGGGGSSAPPDVRITSQPADAHVVAGETAAFTVGLSGAASVQWQRSSGGGAWTDIGGATAAQYVTGATQLSDSGDQFRAIVTRNTGATLTSAAATLTVDPAPVAPAITVQPADATVINYDTAAFSVTASGTSLVYRWQRSPDGVAWADAFDGEGATLLMTGLTTYDSGTRLRVVVSNSAGSVTSAWAHLTVLPTPVAPTFTTSPVSQSVIVGHAVSFDAQASGTPAPDITWQTSTDGVNWSTIAGEHGGTYTIAAASLQDNGRMFRAIATNASGSVNSNAATLAVNPVPVAPAIVTQPASVTTTIGASVTLGVSATGQPTPGYQWQVSTDGGASFTNINGANFDSYLVFGAAQSQDGWRYRVVVSNEAGTVTSAVATLSVVASPSITLQPMWTAWRPGVVPAFFLGGATGPDVTLQWQASPDGTNWRDVAGATGSSFVYPIDGDPSVNYVRFVASNGGGSVSSYSARLYKSFWKPVTPSVTSAHLYAATWTDASTVLALGAGDLVMRSTDGGATWSMVAELLSGTPNALAASGQTVIGVGTSGSVIRSFDGGAHWLHADYMYTPTATLHGVAFFGGVATAVGDSGAISRSSDGGATWQAAVSDAGSANLGGVVFNASGVGIAVGDGGTVLRSINGGANWMTVRTGAEMLNDVAFVDATTVVAVGYQKVLRSTDAGLTWQEVSTGTTLDLERVAFDGAGNGTATCAWPAGRLHTTDGGQTWTSLDGLPSVEAVAYAPTGTAAVAVGGGGEFETSSDSGATWSVRTPGNRNGLFGIAFASGSVGVAVGDAGTILRTADGGSNWAPASTPPVQPQLLGVAFASDQVGVAVGDSGTIWRTTDAGATWSAVYTGSGVRFQGVAFSTAAQGVAVGPQNILWTDDAGATWHYASGGGDAGATAVAFSSPLVGVAVGPIASPFWGFANGIVLRTTDGGKTWQPGSLPVSVALEAVAFSDASHVMAVGENGDVYSLDGGQTWLSEPWSWRDWTALHFNSPTEGIAVSWDGDFYASHDGGMNWPDWSFVVGDYIYGMAVSPTGATFVATLGGAIYRNDAP